MNEVDINDIIDEADSHIEKQNEEPLSFEEWLEYVVENPQSTATSAQYLLNAIEASGTRTVNEDGEEKERWRFFDDPYNDGEHAVLGNTEVLNEFVENLRQIASPNSRTQKLLWIEGPTATGKSEFKRCIINGLKKYSQTDEGRRFRCEWNVNTKSNTRGLSWADEMSDNETDWFSSPVQSHPHSILPAEMREDLLNKLSQIVDGQSLNSKEMDPFSREAYEILQRHYDNSENGGGLFSKITQEKHFRASPYTVKLGQGIGVLHSEDSGKEKQLLIGDWMGMMLQELDSRGRKNPQAFSYDGVLAQGNNGVSIIEDAGQHANILPNLLNIPEEEKTKIDTEISMDIDTVIILISNPDLRAKLQNINAEEMDSGLDPLRALRRRLEHHKFRYLTDYSLETLLLRREVTGESIDVSEERRRETVEDGQQVGTSEAAPHTFEAAAFYCVLTRLDSQNLPNNMSLIDKAKLLTWGEIKENGETKTIDDFDLSLEGKDGEKGIPVTYSRDILSDLLYNNEIVLPQDVINEMKENLTEESVFTNTQAKAYETQAEGAISYILEKQEEDVIDAILRDKTVDKETMREYIEHVYEWGSEGLTEPNVDEADDLKMKVFETRFLDREDDEYDGDEPSDEVEKFRKRIISSINQYIWNNKDENQEFTVDEVPLTEIPELSDLLSSNSWNDVQRRYENLEPVQWDEPPSGTETETVKEKCIENMVDMFGYSEESARKTSEYVFQDKFQR